MKKVVIVGGGISGLFSAYYLSKSNHQITIIDNANFEHGCSHGNAGLIVPSHIIPLASPGVMPQAIKWMFNSYSPFSFHPKLNKDFISWCLKFLQNSTKTHVNNSILPLRNISFLSSNLYKEIAEEFSNSFSLNSKGLLMLYKSEKIAEEETELAILANKNGINTKSLTLEELELLDPNCNYDVLGGIHYLSDSHLTPNVLLKTLVEDLKSKNVEFIPNESISEINVKEQQIISVSSTRKKFEGDSFILSSGVWSAGLLKKIKLNVPLMAGKGYSFNVGNKKKLPTIPSILVDARVAVTPMNKNLRIAGTMEIDSINSKIRINRIQGMVNSFNNYYPKLNVKMPEKKEIWYGLRPCSPDGLPYLGRSEVYKNLFVASGHAMLGLSLGAATGKIISELISEKKTSIDISAFNIERYN